jgi:hypothetical protein
VQNTGVKLSQFKKHLPLNGDFSTFNDGKDLVSQARFQGSRFLDALPVGDRVPRVVLAAPRQPVFDVLIRQPVVDSHDEVTIVVQCKWSELQEQTDTDLSKWLGKVDTSIKTNSPNSSAPSLPPLADPHAVLDGELASSVSSTNRLHLYLAARHITDSQVSKASSAACVLPLDLPSLKENYGPTIARCHMFIMQLDPAEQQANSKSITASVEQTHVTGKTL